MGKKAVMISIDEYMHAKAKERHMNISAVCDMAIKIKLGEAINADEEVKECRHCKAQENLIWECPGEYWVCEKCLKGKVRDVLVRITG